MKVRSIQMTLRKSMYVNYARRRIFNLHMIEIYVIALIFIDILLKKIAGGFFKEIKRLMVTYLFLF